MGKLPYPKNEIIWEGIYYQTGELRYIVTSNRDRSRYYLYELKDGKFVRLGGGPSPKKLKDKFIDWNALRNLELENESEADEPEI